MKESFVYSNKGTSPPVWPKDETDCVRSTGFKNLNQAQLLSDQLYYPDVLDAQQWLVYYISRPLIGSYEPIKITPATLPTILKSMKAGDSKHTNRVPGAESSNHRKDIKSFNDLLNSFPLIARQMQSGLEKVFKVFHNDVRDRPPTPISKRPTHSRRSSTASTTSKTNGSIHSSHSNGKSIAPSVTTLRVDEEEDHMRKTLESAVTAAIDLFQQVDKQQLSFLGASTDLTGPKVERLIERYVTEQLHDQVIFPLLCRSRQMDDTELELRVHAMQHIDIAQVGIAIEDGRRGKEQLMSRIARGVEEFRQVAVAGSAQQMIDILLATQKILASDHINLSSGDNSSSSKQGSDEQEKPASVTTMNADTLVSLLLVVVIRSQVRHLNARLIYMRNFAFVDDVDSGEMGYALSTFEGVLSYLGSDAGGLRKASQKNRRLWQATKQGDLDQVKAILDPNSDPAVDEVREKINENAIEDKPEDTDSQADQASTILTSTATSSSTSDNGYISEGSTLAHVFPLQAAAPTKKGKRVSMDIRSLSNASEYSFVSRTTLDSVASGIEGDTSIETLTQTQDIAGASILLMAVEAQQSETLEYLLSLEDYFPTKILLEDSNKEGTTLLSAAVQLANNELIEILLRRLFQLRNSEQIVDYFARADSRGRTVAHYLFNAPYLISRCSDILPWRKKDKNGQTPLIALCRSYDHANYSDMVNDALQYATHEQGDGLPLHLDDHVDAKGNTLLHVINDPSIAARVLKHCDSDPNATNDKRFTPLMVASKYGRMDMVRALFGDQRVDVLAKELRGMTAVELAKDDEIRNRIDDMVLVSNVPAPDGRVTSVVRSFFVEDASIRLIIKSAVRNDNGMIGITTCRRSLTDFENLAKWLAVEHPASWLPSIFNFRSPFLIPSRPSRAVLQDIQVRLDKFLKMMLAHSTFSTHELLWEFILFPEIQPEMMAERSRRKAGIRAENIRDEYEPLEDTREVSTFVEHAQDSIRGVNHSSKSVIRRVNSMRVGASSTSFPLFPLPKLTTALQTSPSPLTSAPNPSPPSSSSPQPTPQPSPASPQPSNSSHPRPTPRSMTNSPPSPSRPSPSSPPLPALTPSSPLYPPSRNPSTATTPAYAAQTAGRWACSTIRAEAFIPRQPRKERRRERRRGFWEVSCGIRSRRSQGSWLGGRICMRGWRGGR